MADDPRVQQLLDDLLDSECTPEAVCADCPELLPEVRRRWEQMRAVEAELDALFPTPGLDPDATASVPVRPRAHAVLPRIPGYAVEAVLGRGGMGIVYKARQLRLNRFVALKMLLAGAYAGPRERARFQREAEAVASLRHPNIVAVHDVGDHEGCPYFTMELLDGGSLAQTLAGTPQPARQAAALLITLAGAIDAAHHAGIVHRDLKPANILLTADGTPKVADFGLARSFEGEVALTLSGARIGTPSYMAPEQVIGKTGTTGPAADIYALGALLYEMLTGRPPFRGETASETERQVIGEEPVSPARLNPKVPPDLETICLKCLSKEPERRYASAAALADDLRRFGEGRPIQARPVGWPERSWRWCRRNPETAALLAMALATAGLASGSGVWLLQQRAERRAEAARRDGEMHSEIGTAVSQAAGLRGRFHFQEAQELLKQARQRLEPAGPHDLRRLVNHAEADLNLAKRLDAARLQLVTIVHGTYDFAGADRRYAAAFAEAGLGREGDDVAAMAARVNDSALRSEIVGALDEWGSITPDLRRRAWLSAVVRKADPNPLRDRVRQLGLGRGRAELTRLIQEASAAELSSHLATALGWTLYGSGQDAVDLLSDAQGRFPNDFWLNYHLAYAMLQAKRSDDAIGYFRAALAIRPDAVPVHVMFGDALLEKGRRDEAMFHYQRAVRLDDDSVIAHDNLGFMLHQKGQLDEAIDHFRHAIRIEPHDASPHYHLGLALRDKGRLEEGIAEIKQALSIDPKLADAHINIGLAFYSKGRLEEAIDHYHQALGIDPKSIAAHIDLGFALRDNGRLDEAIDHFQQAVRIEPQSGLARNMLIGSSYAVAGAALRAAADQGSEKGRLGESERAAKRRQALNRLRAIVELTTKLHNDGNEVDSSLATWQTDPAFGSVRDPAALAQLPDAVRAEWQRLWSDLSALIDADPLAQGRGFAARRQWAKAADGYARRLMRGETDDGHLWFEYAALTLLSGDRPGYSKACAHMIDRCGKAGGPRAYHVARACTLAPDAVAEASLPGRLAEKELQDSAEAAWSLTEQGALAYRAGHYQPAVAFFEQSLKADTKPGRAVLNWLWLALAKERLGKAEEARPWLSTADTWLDQYRDGMPARAEEELGLHLHNWLEAHVLRREAEALIQSSGSSTPAENR
jgi:serine/threonine-protein kinase